MQVLKQGMPMASLCVPSNLVSAALGVAMGLMIALAWRSNWKTAIKAYVPLIKSNLGYQAVPESAPKPKAKMLVLLPLKMAGIYMSVAMAVCGLVTLSCLPVTWTQPRWLNISIVS